MELPAASHRFGALLGLAALLVSLTAQAGIGRTRGYAAVSPLGEAQYSIPLAVPPGTNGMTPALSLEYRHRTRGGLLGVGWSIGGLSQITRCPRTIAQDGVSATPLRTTVDRFCLDGQRLVVVAPSGYSAPNAEYRTEIESFARIRAVQGTSTNGPAWFAVESADGRIHEYGATHDSRIDGVQGASTGSARTWALNRIRDRAGNVIDYRYTEESVSAAFRIASIRYNANPANGTAASHEIAFTYENRPNQEADAGFVAGLPLRQVVRLDRIDVLHDGAVLRRHDFTYEAALSSGGRSRLASFRECGTGGSDCLAPTTFQWQSAAAGLTALPDVAAAVPAGYVVPGRTGWSIGDLNGDGRSDLLWAGGGTVDSSTMHFRLGLGEGSFGAVVNSGIAARLGLGIPFDANGDGRKDLLMRAANGNFTVVYGGPSGLQAAIDTGVAIPAGMRDLRGADLNGDGLGDLVWSEAPGPYFDDLKVRIRYALPAGGFGAPATLYSQREAMAYDGAEGGEFFGLRVDLDGDGAEDILMNENYTVARISASGYGNDRFDSVFAGLVTLDFNDDDCADYAYKHITGYLRIRLGSCTTFGSSTEMQGPAWSGNAYLQVHDWNADGRDDLLLRGTVNWQVALSRADSVAPIIDTGVPHEGLPTASGKDVDGDGLQDFVAQAASTLRVRLRDGPIPDLLLSATDGFGLKAIFTYKPLTDPAVHVAGSGAKWPEQDAQTNDNVVALLKTTDGIGKGYLSSTGYRYEGLRRDARGRGILGFRKLVRTDLSVTEPLSTETLLRQDYPFAGLPELVVVRRSSGKTVSSTEYRWSKLEWGSGYLARRYPYPSTVTTRSYESGGALDGAEITRSVRGVASIDSLSGLVTDETITTTEVGGGVNAGSSASVRVLHTGVFNDAANWCLGRPQAVQLTASHTLAGGTPVVRTADQDWDGLKCRPTRIRLHPGDTQWQVANDLGYDAYGNVASEKVTGAGMAARTVTIEWDGRGQLPVRVTDPLGQASRYSWDAGSGLLLSFTDPNNAATQWAYDAFGRLTRETQPDRTATQWRRDGCKGVCDNRIRYTMRQDDLDGAGVPRVTSVLYVDQHDRGYLLRSQQPVGGDAITGVDFDQNGFVTQSLLPHWDGDFSPARWTFDYDALGRPTAAALQAVGGPVARFEALHYEGLTVTRVDPLGRNTTFTRSAWGPVSQVVDPQGGVTRYESDAFGALLGVRDALGNGVASIGYSAGGMKLSVADMDRGTWNWTRNALGETTALRDAKGVVTRFDHDKLGRVTQRIAPDGTSTWTWGNAVAKSNIGRLAAVAGPGYSEDFTYDSIGRPATHAVNSDASYLFSFKYNALGLLDVLTFPAAGPGAALKVRHDYGAGRVVRLGNADPTGESWWTLNAQDAAGNALDETFGSSLRVVSGFSPLTGELEYRQSGINGGVAVQDLDWDWDAAGNLMRRRDLAQGLAEDFRYDSLDRLVDSRRNGTVNLELAYDAIGNILRKSDVCTGSTPCYTYHSKRRHAVVSAGGRQFSYDANGNMTTRGGAAIAWTNDGLPRSITHSNGNSSQFSYGPAGNRWKQVAKSGSVTETTHYAGGWFGKSAKGSVTTWRHYLPAPGGIAVQTRSSDGTATAMRYLTLDHLGSTDRITDAAGNVVVAESFGAFGARRKSNWSGIPTAGELAQMAAVTRDGFTGHEHLDNVELIHMNGRVYDPLLGRFISADPFVPRPHDGQGLNRYGYVLNNPLAFTDPSGFDPVPCLATQSGNCVQITVIAATWAQYMRATGGAHASEVASALERDPCGQNGSALACSMASGRLVSPSSIVLTVGRNADPSLPANGPFDAVQGFAARVANLTISSSPIALLFGADPDFQYFREPPGDMGRAGATAGNVGYLLGGMAGIVRKGGSEILKSPSDFARSLQGNRDYPGIDRFKDITLKKGTIIYGGFPGQGFFYTTRSAIRRVGDSIVNFNRGLQIAPHRTKPPRSRYAAYEVLSDTPAAFALATANSTHGHGWLPQVVVPSYRSSLQYLGDFALTP
jgi:RHS repeat-associated protein